MSYVEMFCEKRKMSNEKRKLEQLEKSKTLAFAEVLSVRREDRIRTCDPLVPNQVRYRPALLPERGQMY